MPTFVGNASRFQPIPLVRQRFAKRFPDTLDHFPVLAIREIASERQIFLCVSVGLRSGSTPRLLCVPCKWQGILCNCRLAGGPCLMMMGNTPTPSLYYSGLMRLLQFSEPQWSSALLIRGNRSMPKQPPEAKHVRRLQLAGAAIWSSGLTVAILRTGAPSLRAYREQSPQACRLGPIRRHGPIPAPNG